jgi:hypothetical protein
MLYQRKRHNCLAITALCMGLGLIASASAQVINLGGVAAYAVVAVGGDASTQSLFKLYQSGTVIDGNVAEGPYTTLGHNIDATINGRWDYDLTDNNPLSDFPGSNIPSGGFHQISLSSVSADARAAALQGMGYTPTQTFASLTNGQTVLGSGGVNVIRVTGDSSISGGSSTLTLQGTASDIFIFQFTSPTTAGHDILNLSGVTMNITGVNANNIYWDFAGLGGDVNISSGATVYGNFLAPDRNLTSDHGNVFGRLIAGGSGSLLNIHSTSHITVVPEPSSAVLAGAGLAVSGAIAAFRRRRQRSV